MPLRLRMELDVPAADDALRSDLAHWTGHRDTELIARAGLAVVFRRDAEGAGRRAAVPGAGEPDSLRRFVWVERRNEDGAAGQRPSASHSSRPQPYLQVAAGLTARVPGRPAQLVIRQVVVVRVARIASLG